MPGRRLLTLDLHSEQIQGFFAIPVDNVYGSPVLDVYKRQGYISARDL